MSYRPMKIITRDNFATERAEKVPSWFEQFAENLQKEAVKSKRDDYSLFNELHSIIGKKPKYSSVEEAVLDMQKRTGLYDVLNKKKQNNKKYASYEILQQIPEIKIFVDNYIDARPGTSIPAVIHDLLKINSIREKLPNSDDVPSEIKEYIADKLKEINLSNGDNTSENMQLGKVDVSFDEHSDNDDFFAICLPTANGK